MNPLWILKLKSAFTFFQKHWGKISAGAFLLVWMTFTVILYNGNQNLHEEIGASGVAISVCIAERNNRDKSLAKIRKDLAKMQANNAEYKARLIRAGIRIDDLEEEIANSDIDVVYVPIECEDTFNWMRERAMK